MMDKIRQDIDRFKHSIINVPRNAFGPGFLYTIGVHESFARPEFIVVGVPRDVGAWLIGTLVRRVMTGSEFMPDQKYSGILEAPYRLGLKMVHSDLRLLYERKARTLLS